MGRLWQQLLLMKQSPMFEFISTETLIHQKTTRILHDIRKMRQKWRFNFVYSIFFRKDYLNFHKGLSRATASRDLNTAVESGLLKRTGDKAQARYSA